MKRTVLIALIMGVFSLGVGGAQSAFGFNSSDFVLPSSHRCSINAAGKHDSGPDSGGSIESCLKVTLSIGQNRNGSGALARGGKTNYLQIKVFSDSKLPEQSTPLYIRLPQSIRLGKLPSGLKSMKLTGPFEKSSEQPNSDGSSALLVYGSVTSRPGKSAAYSIPLQLIKQGSGVIEAGVEDPTGGEGQTAVQPLTWSPSSASRSYTASPSSDQLVRHIMNSIEVKGNVATKCPGEKALRNRVCPAVEELLAAAPAPTPTPPAPVYFLLSVLLAGGGGGSVTSSPTGISCLADCSKNFLAGSSVQLTAQPDANSTFSHWTGACSDTKTPTCLLTVSDALSTSAVFHPGALASGVVHSARLVRTADTSCAIGRMVYSDARGDVFPSQQLPVRAYDQNNGIDDLLAQSLTDSEGRFRLCFDNTDTAWAGGGNADLYLQFKTAVAPWQVVDHCCLDTGLTPFAYTFATSVRDNIADGDSNYGDLSAAPNRQRALHVFDTMRQGWQWTNTHSPAGTGSCWAMRPGNGGSIVGPRQAPDCNQKTVMWAAPGEGGEFPTTWPHYGSCMAAAAANYICLTPTIPDWPSVGLHELGHNVMQDIHQGTFGIPFTGMPPHDCPSSHYFESDEDTGCAWTEGWATLFAWMVRDQALLGGGEGIDATRYGEKNNDLSSWQDYRGNNRGSNVESRIAGSLWDIADNTNEQPYDKLSVGTSALWNAFTSPPGRNFPDFLAILARNGAIDQSSQDYRSTLYGNTISFTPFSEPLASGWVRRPMPPVAAPSTYSNSSTGHTFKIDRPARISACPDLVVAQNIWTGVSQITAIRSSGLTPPTYEERERLPRGQREDWGVFDDYFFGPVRYNEIQNYRNSMVQVAPPSSSDPGGVNVGSQDFPYRFHLRSFEDQALQHMTANSGPDLNLFAAGNISIELPAQPRTAYVQTGGSVPPDGRDGRPLNVREIISGQHVAGTVMPGFKDVPQENHYQIKLLRCHQLVDGTNSQPSASVINSVALMQAGAIYHITAAPSGTSELAKGADLQLEIRALKDDCVDKQSAENCDWKKAAAKKADRRKKGQPESITFIAPQTGLYRIYGINKAKQAVPWTVRLSKG